MSRSDLSFTVSAPGKVILFGEHSVVHNKLAIAASLGLRTYLHFSECVPSNKIVIEIPNVDLTYSVDFKVVQELLQKNLLKDESSNTSCASELVDHVVVVAHVRKLISENCTVKFTDQQVTSLIGIFFLLYGILHSINNLSPFKLTINSDLCLGAGTGSSASFAVTTAASFIYYKHLKLVRTNLTEFSEGDKSLISKWAYCTEKIFHGLPSGIDNSICTYGSMVKFRKSEGMQFITSCEFQLLLVNTKVARFTKQILNDVIVLMENHSAIMESIWNTMDLIAESAVRSIIELANNTTNSALYSRLQQLTEMNQCMLQSIGVSHAAINKVCSILTKVGLSGKLTGAGRGGYVIAIIPPYFSANVVENLIEQLHLDGFDAVLTKLGDSGVNIV